MSATESVGSPASKDDTATCSEPSCPRVGNYMGHDGKPYCKPHAIISPTQTVTDFTLLLRVLKDRAGLLEAHGCTTGDCLHDKQAECDADLAEYATAVLNSINVLFPSPAPTAEQGNYVCAECGTKEGVAWTSDLLKYTCWKCRSGKSAPAATQGEPNDRISIEPVLEADSKDSGMAGLEGSRLNNWNSWAEHCATEFCSLRAFPNENAREHAWSGYFNGFREGRNQARVLIQQLEVTIARLGAKVSRPDGKKTE